MRWQPRDARRWSATRPSELATRALGKNIATIRPKLKLPRWNLPALATWEAARRAVAAAKSTDEVKEILDVAVAMRAYAKQAKDFEMEADAVEIRMRATRRLDDMRRAQAATVGLATGCEHGGRLRLDGSRVNPVKRPCHARVQGIDKHLAHQGRVLGRLSEAEFECKVAEARAAVGRVVRRVVREAETSRSASATAPALKPAAPSPIWLPSQNRATAPALLQPIRHGRFTSTRSKGGSAVPIAITNR